MAMVVGGDGHSRTSQRLFGRRGECALLDRMLVQAEAGCSQVLVLRGEAGIGKTALLDQVSEKAQKWQLLRTAGVENEMELPFASVQQLCAPMLGRLPILPEPQADALAAALGLRAGGTPDRFLVGLGILTLFAEAAARQPVVCVVDDVQWLDRSSAQSLAFVARRLRSEPIVLLFATRPGANPDVLAGLPELPVRGLRESDSHALLDSVLLAPFDPAVRDRLVAETQGNPLALLELHQGLTPAELAGGYALPRSLPVVARLEETFRRRIDDLPPETRQLLVVAAADPLGDRCLFWRAAEYLGIPAVAADPAVSEGLIEIGTHIRFRSPVVRSIAYRAATTEDRRAAHRALAEATDPRTDPDRQAWHRACAICAADEAVADELARSAERALARGGAAAAAAFLRRAMEITPEPTTRGIRALAAARATIDAGAPDAAVELLATAERCSLSEVDRARLERLRAELAFSLSRGNEAPRLLLNAAKRLEQLDHGLARETYLEALSATQFSGRLSDDIDVLTCAAAARTAPPAPAPARPHDVLLDGLATRFIDGYASAVPILRHALAEFRDGDLSVEESLRWLFRATTTALDLWDDRASELFASRHVEVARNRGALAVLPLALTMRISIHVFAGELSDAALLVEELKAVVDALGFKIAPYGELLLAAWRGREAEAAELMATTEKAVMSRGEGVGLSVIEWASALLANAAGRYEDALAPAHRASEHTQELGISLWALVEVVESASRLGDFALASGALERLRTTTQAARTDWGLGIEARSSALVSSAGTAEPLYCEAIDRLSRTRLRPELARSHLVYGEWLRRMSRRIDAREHLRAAHALFGSIGAEAFAERARRELVATGETVRKRSVETLTELTAQEAQIARLAADLHTNPEIANLLFLSPRTVEWHLRKVFTKLGITSRRELRAALPR